MFIPFNPNPRENLTTDCTVRAANGQYSQRYSSAPYNYHMYPEYDDYSFARGRQGGYSGNRQGNYSSNYPNSYSGNKDAMRQKLSQMMTELDSM